MATKKTTETKNHTGLGGADWLKYKICISGAAVTAHCSPDTLQKAETIGREIAKRNMVLVTGATTGVPYWAAKGAKQAGGVVIGISPAASKVHHIKSYHLPVDYHDLIIYTGFGYAGRDLLLVRSADAVVSICGRIGTLNEFTSAFEDRKPLGILTKTGGAADMIKEILQRANAPASPLVADDDPEKLIEKVLGLIKTEEKGLE